MYKIVLYLAKVVVGLANIFLIILYVSKLSPDSQPFLHPFFIKKIKKKASISIYCL